MDDSKPAPAVREYATLIIVIVSACVLVGFVSGIREPAAPRAPTETVRIARDDSVPDAVPYRELASAHIRPNANWVGNLNTLQFVRPNPFDPVIRTEEMKMRALEDRSRVRAFDGAPPTIPHPVDAMQSGNCVACHGSGLRVGDKLATKISHPYMTNCTQCHVESARPEFDRFPAPPAENGFIGIVRAGPGERAWPGAPPTIPHTTWMRQDCASCHGLLARPGIRTTHPWLTNCTQCHALSAALDRVEFQLPGNGPSR